MFDVGPKNKHYLRRRRRCSFLLSRHRYYEAARIEASDYERFNLWKKDFMTILLGAPIT